MADEQDEIEILAEADWVNEDSTEQGSFWRFYLHRQLWRAAGVLIVILILSALRSAGPAGEWILGRLGAATKTDFSELLAGSLRSPALHKTWAEIRGWFGRELQVSGPSLAAVERPPMLTWPVRGARILPRGPHSSNNGLDLQVPAGTPIQAAAGGTVAETRQEADGGITIVLRHGRYWRTVYSHSQAALVRAGENVADGQTIGLVGGAAAAGDPHLHFEFWGPDGPLDPSPYLGTKATPGGPL